MHLDDLRVLHHLPQIWVDDVLEELVLGGAWGGHGRWDLTENSKKRDQMIFSAIWWLTGSGSIYRFFILQDKHTKEKRSTKGVPGAP